MEENPHIALTMHVTQKMSPFQSPRMVYHLTQYLMLVRHEMKLCCQLHILKEQMTLFPVEYLDDVEVMPLKCNGDGRAVNRVAFQRH